MRAALASSRGFSCSSEVGVGAAFFFVDAEGRQRQAGEGHWGGAFGIAMLGIWLAVLGAIAAYNLRKFLK